MRINPKALGAWLPGETAQAKRAKKSDEAPVYEKARGQEEHADATKPAVREFNEVVDTPNAANSDAQFLAQAESFSEDLALRLKNASGSEVANTLRDLKLREAALRQALRTNEALVPSGLIEFLH